MRLWEFIGSKFLFHERPADEPFILDESKEKTHQKFYDIYGKKETVKISSSLRYNVDYMKQRYYYEKNSDLILRDFNVTVQGKQIPAAAFFFDGLVNKQLIGQLIMMPVLKEITEDVKPGKMADYLMRNVISQNQVKLVVSFDRVLEELNFGGCIIFVDGCAEALVMDVKGWEHRSISDAKNEVTIKGPQEAFCEVLRINTALIRKTLKNEALVNQNFTIGEMSKTPTSLLYINNIANQELVQEVQRRLNNIKVSYVMDTGELEQFLMGDEMMLTPQVLSTERPDRVAMALNEGKIAILLDGSPYALILPINVTSFINLTEDRYMKYNMTNFLRVIRLVSLVASLMLPAFFISVVGFHPEILETELFFTIENAKAQTPFPLLIELFAMEFAFELIKEAGLRIPGPIGPTIGIVGALIMGQAAVEAKIASSILIIVVAFTGLGSFATPSYDYAFSLRVTRFFYTVAAAVFGFFGIALVLFVHASVLCSANSLGVPFITPVAPHTGKNTFDTFFVKPLWKQEFRDDSLQTQLKVKQPKISKVWKNNQKY